MRPITVTAGPLAAADADGIAQAQNPASTFTLNGALVSGGVAQLGAPRRVLITTTANETGVTFTVTGTNLAGDVLTEALVGVNNTTTYTTLDFYTVTSVTNSTTLTGNVTIGTNGVADPLGSASTTTGPPTFLCRPASRAPSTTPCSRRSTTRTLRRRLSRLPTCYGRT